MTFLYVIFHLICTILSFRAWVNEFHDLPLVVFIVATIFGPLTFFCWGIVPFLFKIKVYKK